MIENRQHDITGSSTKLSHTPWMMTLADLLSLMLTFFVLLFSMGEVPKGAWISVVDTFAKEFSHFNGDVQETDSAIDARSGQVEKPGLGLGYLENLLLTQLDNVDGFEAIQVYIDDGRVVLSLPGPVFFDAASVDWVEDGEARADKLAMIISSVPNRILLGVHNPPVVEVGRAQMGILPGLDRARLLAKQFKMAGVSQDITVIGYGAARFSRLNPEIDLTDRIVLSDRIDLVFLRDGEDKEIYGLF